LIEDVDLQEIGQKIKAAQEKEQNFKETMSIFPLEEKMTARADNKNLYYEMNQMRAEQQALAQKMDLLQEEAYKVA
jgi:predicted  nucleic acid-binding Zn-ribbon protein